MPEWKAAMILPLLYVNNNDLTMWNRIASIVENRGYSSSAFSAARLTLKMYGITPEMLRDYDA